MNNDESTDIRELIQNSEDNLVELSTGEKLFGDFLEFLEFVDFFASRYGLGGHKSIEEYAEMINQTDPVLLHGLRDAGVRAENRKWGAEDDSDSSDFKDGKQDIHTATGDNDKNAFDSGKKPNLSTIDGKGGLDLRNMLLEFGVDKGELNKATEKIKGRKIILKDYGYLSENKGRELKLMSPEKFKTLLKEMSKENSKAINFDVSDDMFRAKLRKQRSGK